PPHTLSLHDALPISPRCTKDLIEEQLFARRRDLFSELSLCFFDTTSLYFEGDGGATLGRRGNSRDYRPQLNQMILGVVLDDAGRDRKSTRLNSSHVA